MLRPRKWFVTERLLQLLATWLVLIIKARALISMITELILMNTDPLGEMGLPIYERKENICWKAG